MNAEEPEFSALERALRQFTPTPLSEPLRHQLEAAVTSGAPLQSPTLADRILLLWTASGALAACFVALLTFWQLAAAPRRTPVSTQDIALQQQAQQEIQQLLASR